MLRRGSLALGLAILTLPFLGCADSIDSDTLIAPDVAVEAKGGTKGKPDKNDDNPKSYGEITIDAATNIAVLMPGDPDYPELGVGTDYSPLQVAMDSIEEAEEEIGEHFYGCPNTDLPCNVLELHYSGWADYVGLGSYHILDGLWGDETLEHNFRALGPGYGVLPAFSLDGTTPITIYWQGQQSVAGYDAATGTRLRYLRVTPDLDLVGQEDRFRLVLGYQSGARTTSRRVLPVEAEFQGAEAGGNVYAHFDRIGSEQATRGRGKKATSGRKISFDLQSFTTPDPAAGENVEVIHDVMLTRPDGSRAIVGSYSIGINPDDPEKPDIYKQEYASEELTQKGCYVFEVVGAGVVDYDYPSHIWDSAKDDAALYVIISEQGDVTVNQVGCQP